MKQINLIRAAALTAVLLLPVSASANIWPGEKAEQEVYETEKLGSVKTELAVSYDVLETYRFTLNPDDSKNKAEWIVDLAKGGTLDCEVNVYRSTKRMPATLTVSGSGGSVTMVGEPFEDLDYLMKPQAGSYQFKYYTQYDGEMIRSYYITKYSDSKVNVTLFKDGDAFFSVQYIGEDGASRHMILLTSDFLGKRTDTEDESDEQNSAGQDDESNEQRESADRGNESDRQKDSDDQGDDNTDIPVQKRPAQQEPENAERADAKETDRSKRQEKPKSDSAKEQNTGKIPEKQQGASAESQLPIVLDPDEENTDYYSDEYIRKTGVLVGTCVPEGFENYHITVPLKGRQTNILNGHEYDLEYKIETACSWTVEGHSETFAKYSSDGELELTYIIGSNYANGTPCENHLGRTEFLRIRGDKGETWLLNQGEGMRNLSGSAVNQKMPQNCLRYLEFSPMILFDGFVMEYCTADLSYITAVQLNFRNRNDKMIDNISVNIDGYEYRTDVDTINHAGRFVRAFIGDFAGDNWESAYEGLGFEL